MTMTAMPADELYAWAASGRVESRSNKTHGAATPNRAALTIQDCRASISERIAASWRKYAARLRSTVVNSLPPTSRDIRRFDDAVGDGIGEAVLHPVEAVRESPGHAI